MKDQNKWSFGLNYQFNITSGSYHNNFDNFAPKIIIMIMSTTFLLYFGHFGGPRTTAQMEATMMVIVIDRETRIKVIVNRYHAR